MAEARIVAAQAFAEQKAEELPDGRELPRPRRRGEALAAQGGKEVADGVGARIPRVPLLGRREGEELAQVAGIGFDRFLGGAALGHEHVEKEPEIRAAVRCGDAFPRAQISSLSALRPMGVERLEADPPRLGV